MSGLNNDDIIRMAKEAGLYTKCEVHSAVPFDQLLTIFAALIAAAIDNKYLIKFTHEEYNAVIDAAVADGAKMEREACAELVSDLGDAEDDGEFFRVLKDAAIAIRTRGQE